MRIIHALCEFGANVIMAEHRFKNWKQLSTSLFGNPVGVLIKLAV